MRPAAPVHLEPEVTVFAWAVIHAGGDLRLVGYRADTKQGRVTSPLVEFNTADMTMKTLSGRVYHLRGGESRDEAWPLVLQVREKLQSEVGYVALGDAAMALAPQPGGKPH